MKRRKSKKWYGPVLLIFYAYDWGVTALSLKKMHAHVTFIRNHLLCEKGSSRKENIVHKAF